MSTNVIKDVVGAQSLSGRTLDTLRQPDDVRHFLPLDVIQPSIRQSGIGTAFKCLRMFLFKERLGLVPSGYAPSATIGQLVHLAHNARYTGLDEPAVNQILSHATNDIQNALEGWAEESGRADRAQSLSESVEKDAALARVMSYLHWQKYPLHTDPCWVCGQSGCQGLSVVSLEKEYTAKVEGLPGTLGGRLDLVLKHVGNGIDGLLITDHKTTGVPINQWIESKGFASQPRLYRILLEAQPEFAGIPVIGFVYNMILRPSCKWKDKQKFEDYIRECQDWYEGRDDTVGAPKLSTGKKGGYILEKDGTPKLYPRWEWSSNAERWEVDGPPMRRHFQLFDEPALAPEFLNKLRIVSKATSAEPTLSNFVTSGEDSAGCRFYNKRCAYLDFCGSPPDTWQSIMERGWTLRESAPESSDIEDYV